MNNIGWAEDNERNTRIYTNLISQFGVDARSLGWRGPETQRLRFAVLSQVGELRGASMLDVGCGLGDLFGWLKETDIEVDYTGIDITPKAIEVARNRFPGTRFELADLLGKAGEQSQSYDYVVASGIFTYRDVEPVGFQQAMIARMFTLCTKAVAFNSLSDWASSQESDEFYADPLETMRFCRTLTPWLVLRHDYHPRDFSIYMYKRQP